MATVPAPPLPVESTCHEGAVPAPLDFKTDPAVPAASLDKAVVEDA